MERPEVSLMGIQSGDNYLINTINEYSKYADFLEAELIKTNEELEEWKQSRTELAVILGMRAPE